MQLQLCRWPFANLGMRNVPSNESTWRNAIQQLKNYWLVLILDDYCSMKKNLPDLKKKIKSYILNTF